MSKEDRDAAREVLAIADNAGQREYSVSDEQAATVATAYALIDIAESLAAMAPSKSAAELAHQVNNAREKMYPEEKE